MKTKLSLLLFLTAILLGACGTTAPQEVITDQDLVATAVDQLREEQAALEFQTSEAQPEQPPENQIEPEHPTPTQEPIPPGIPGLDPFDLVVQLQDQGFTCISPEWINQRVTWICDYVTEDFEFAVTAWGSAPDTLDLVEAAAFYYGDLDSYADLTSLIFGQISKAAFANLPSQPSAWVENMILSAQELGDEELTSFDSVRIYIFTLPGSQVMEIGSLPYQP